MVKREAVGLGLCGICSQACQRLEIVSHKGTFALRIPLLVRRLSCFSTVSEICSDSAFYFVAPSFFFSVITFLCLLVTSAPM